MLESITELLERNPFVPFRITMTSGHTFDIPNPHLVAQQKTQMIVCEPTSDKWHILRHNQIATVEVLEPAA